MTSEGLDQAFRFLAEVIRMAADPVVMARLKSLQSEVDGTSEWLKRFDPVEGYEREATRGTCPTCGRMYVFAGDQGGLRRHGKGKCAIDTQMAAEIAPAVLLISQLGEVSTEGKDDGGAQRPDTDHV